MLEEVRVYVNVRRDDETDIDKHFSTNRDDKAIDKAIAYLEKVKQQPIKKPEVKNV